MCRLKNRNVRVKAWSVAFVVILLGSTAATGVAAVPAAATSPATPTAAPAPETLDAALSSDLARLVALASLSPEFERLFAFVAAERGTPLPPEAATRALLKPCPSGEHPLPAVVAAFAAFHGGLGPDAVAREQARASALPREMQCALATLLLALMDAAVLQTRALGTLTADDLAALSSPSLTSASQSLLLARADPASGVQAARLVDHAVRETAPVLEKWGLLAQVNAVSQGLPLTPDHALGEVPLLASGDPRYAYQWAMRLAGVETRAELPVLPVDVPSLESLLWVLYLQLEVPITPGVAWSLAASRHLPPDVASAAARNLAAVVVANEAWRQSLANPVDASALLAAQDVGRIASAPGISASDLLLLRAHVETLRAAENPNVLAAAGLLLAAATETGAAPPAAPTSPWFVATPTMAASSEELANETVLGSRFIARSHSNGSYELWIDINGDGQRDTPPLYSPAAYAVVVDEAHCRVVIAQDANDDGFSEGHQPHDVVNRDAVDFREPTRSNPIVLDGEILYDTGSSCDTNNDVIYRDPYGYVAILGEGSTVVGDDFGGFEVRATNQPTAASVVASLYGSTPLPFFEAALFGTLYSIAFAEKDKPFDFLPQCEKNLETDFVSIGDPCETRPDVNEMLEFYLRSRVSVNATINPDRYQYLTLDLGGDDLYLNNAGGTYNASWIRARPQLQIDPGAGPVCPFANRADYETYCVHTTGYPWRTPVALAVDLGGNDRYVGSRSFSAGAASGGVGVLYDRSGDDVYEGTTDALGSANATGILLNPTSCHGESGDNGRCNQGMILNLPAAGILFDEAGNDDYRAGLRSLASAQGSLVQEASPLYAPNCGATAENAQPVANPHIGCITRGGLPVAASIGFFFDLAGDDTYRADELSLGAGNRSSVGLFVERVGDDAYTSLGRVGQSQGQGHGTGHGVMLDLAGRDTGFISNGGFVLDNYIAARFNVTAIGTGADERRDLAGRGASLALDLEVSPLMAEWEPAADEGVVAVPGFRAEWLDLPTYSRYKPEYRFAINVPSLFAVDDATSTLWKAPAMLAVDLAGADTYLNAPGRAIFNESSVRTFDADEKFGRIQVGPNTSATDYFAPVALNLDLSGADVYDASSVATPYVRLPFSAAGAKSFPGRALGYGFSGIGALYDLGASPDVYRIGHRGLGAGEALGIGLFYDEAGNDLYDATAGHDLSVRDLAGALPVEEGRSLALGFASGAGTGFFVDASGHDTYIALNLSLGAAYNSSNQETGFFYDGRGRDQFRAFPMTLGWVNTTKNQPIPPTPLAGATNSAQTWDSRTTLGIFVNDGLDLDLYEEMPQGFPADPDAKRHLTRAPCDEKHGPATANGDRPRDNAVWCQTNKTVSDSPTNEWRGDIAVASRAGRGYDNVDAAVNAQVHRIVMNGTNAGWTQPRCQVVSQGGVGKICVSPNQTSRDSTHYMPPNAVLMAVPEFAAFRSVLLAPAAYDVTVNPVASVPAAPASSDKPFVATNLARVGFQASYGTQSIGENAKALVSLILDDERYRHTCQAQTLAGSFGFTDVPTSYASPFYCSYTRQYAGTPSGSAVAANPSEIGGTLGPLELLVLGEALHVVALQDPLLHDRVADLQAAFVEAALSAASGGVDAARAVAFEAIDRATRPQNARSQGPTNPEPHGDTQGATFADHEAVGSFEIRLCVATPCREKPTLLLASFDASGLLLPFPAADLGPVGNVKNCVSAQDSEVVRCETVASTPAYRQFRYFFLWDTEAITPRGQSTTPDGSYQVQILTSLRRSATYQRDLEKSAGDGVRGPVYAESSLNNLANDNYGHWPGFFSRSLTVDNVPRLLPSAWVSDFNPTAETDAQRTIYLIANVTEPAAAQGEIVWPDGRVTNLTQVSASTCGRTRLTAPALLNQACPSENFEAPAQFGPMSSTDAITYRVVMPLGAPTGLYKLRLFLTDVGHDLEARAGQFRSGLIERDVWGDTSAPVSAILNLPAWTNVRNGLVRVANETAGIARGIERGDFADSDPEVAWFAPRLDEDYAEFILKENLPNTARSRQLWRETVVILNLTLTPDQSLLCDKRACGAPMRVWLVDMTESNKYEARTQRFVLRCPQHCLGRGQEAEAFLRVPAFHGSTYAFAVTAIDNAGNVQATSSAPVETKIDTLGDASNVYTIPIGRKRIGADTVATIEWSNLQDKSGAWGHPRFAHVLFNVSGPGETPRNWSVLPRSFISTVSADASLMRATFSGNVLSGPGYNFFPASMIRDGNLVHLMVLAVDAAGNVEAETLDVTKIVSVTPFGNLSKAGEAPMPFDVTPPKLTAAPTVEVSPSRVDLTWTFDENATGILEWGTLEETAKGNYPNRLVPERLDRGVSTERANITALDQNTTYRYRIVATDEVDNAGAIGPFLFTTEAVLELSMTSPEVDTTWTRSLRIAWGADVVKVPVGKRKDAVAYNFTLVVNERVEDPYYIGVAGPFSEAEAGNPLHVRTFEFSDRDLTGRVIPDTSRAYVRVCGEATLNKGAPICVNSPNFAIDNSPPITRATALGPHVGSWYRSIVDVSFASEDAVSPVRTTYWSPVNRSTEFKAVDKGLRFADEGRYNVYYYSVDTQGNAESVKSVSFQIDRTAPTGRVVINDGVASVQDRNVTLEIRAQDGPSGIDALVVSSSGVTPLTIAGDRLRDGVIFVPWALADGDADKLVEVRVIDRAGNVVSLRDSIVLDTRPPVLEGLAFQGISYETLAVAFSTTEPATTAVSVKRALDPGYREPVEGQRFITSHRVALSGLSPSTAYVARVDVTDALGNTATYFGNFSTLADVTPPSGVSDLVARDDGTGVVNLTWNSAVDNVRVDRYAVHRGEAGLPSTLIGFTLTTRFLDDTVVPGQSYTYEVVAIDAAQNRGPPSAPVSGRATTRPEALAGGVDPASAVAGQRFTFSVIYRDADNDPPAFVRVWINGQVFDMKRQNAADRNFAQGVTYVHSTSIAETRLSTGLNTYRFEVSDGTHLARFPFAGESVGPAVLASGAGSGAASESGVFAEARSIPVAGLPILLGAFGVAAYLVLRRRWS